MFCRPASFYSRRKNKKNTNYSNANGTAANGTAALHKETENGDVATTNGNDLSKRTSYVEIDEKDDNDITPSFDEPGTSPLTPAIISNINPSVGVGDSGTTKQRNKTADNETAQPTLPEAAPATDRPSPLAQPAWRMLTNVIVLKYAVSVSLAHTGYGNIFTMLPAHANDVGLTPTHTTLLLSLIGAADIVSAVLTGIFSNANFVRRVDLFLAAITLNGALFFLAPLLTDFVRLALFGVTISFTAVAFIVLVPVLLAEELGVARLPMALGITNMAVGLVFLFTPVVLGT